MYAWQRASHKVRNLVIAAVLGATAAAPAYAVEPASGSVALVSSLDQTLLDVMQHAQQLGYKGRYGKLAPVVSQIFDLPYMTKIAVGAGWSTLTSEQQGQLADAFGKFITATYARRFDGYSGEKFVTQGERPLGTATLVQTQLIKSDGEPVSLNYVTREGEGRWQIVDVFLTGTISELATRRSEFSSVFRRAGFEGLLLTLQQKTAQIATDSQVS